MLVGITDYGLYDPTGATDLRGCVNDQTDYHRLCRALGYPIGNLHVLTDRAATAKNIFEEAEWLASKLNEDSSNEGIFSFAGHGTLYKQRPCLCSADMDWSNPVTFKKLGDVLKIIEGVNLSVFLDCCHSGGKFRNFNGPFDMMSEDKKGRFLAPPPDLEEDHCGFFCPPESPGERVMAPKSDSYRHVSSDRDIILTGCDLNQTSADAYLGGAYHGAFTYNLMRILEQQHFIRDEDGYFRLSYVELRDRLERQLRRGGFKQTPQYEGPKEYEDLWVFRLPQGVARMLPDEPNPLKSV